MGILRPIQEGQVEITLVKDDGKLRYISDFIMQSEVGALMVDGKRVYNPIEIVSCFDPIHFKDLINHCIDYLGATDQTFTISTSVRCLASREVLCHFEAQGCVLVGYSLPKFNKESGEYTYFKLTFQPGEVSNILT